MAKSHVKNVQVWYNKSIKRGFKHGTIRNTTTYRLEK